MPANKQPRQLGAKPGAATPVVCDSVKQSDPGYGDVFTRATEPSRAVLEAGAFGVSCGALVSLLPEGDGHPVLVLPGFATSDLYTCSLRAYLRALGYAAEPWRLGRNLGRPATLVQVQQRLSQLHRRTNQPISIVGHSLGGVYARELARGFSSCVRQVITLGSPFALDPMKTNSPTLARLYRRLQLSDQRLDPPPVPTTAIYSKNDGVVDWRSCLEAASHQTENLEVTSSHLGMTVHPSVLYILANRLAQPHEGWRKFRQPGSAHERWYTTAAREV